LWLSVQKLINEPVHIVVWDLLLKARAEQGWVQCTYEGLEVEKLSKKNWWREGKKIIQNNPDAIHLFAGFWTIRAFFPLILYALKHGINTAIYYEPFSTSSVGYFRDDPHLVSWTKVKIRPTLYHLTGLLIKIISKKKQPCYLPISLLAKEQFIHAGFDKNNLFPFGYFISQQNKVIAPLKKDGDGLKIVFVGSFIKRKGLDIAIQAVETLYKKGYRISLDIFGPGNPDLFWSPSSICVNHKGVIPQAQAQQVIALYDLLILPSRHDGWGVVVNEALLQGVPTIVSDHVGAKCLIEKSGAGLVFKSQDSDDLASRIESILIDNKKLIILRECAARVKTQITPDSAAKYLYDVFNFYFLDQGKRPSAIWSD
jgi:glycosyltransferase involved in cell wall biosynthesis